MLDGCEPSDHRGPALARVLLRGRESREPRAPAIERPTNADGWFTCMFAVFLVSCTCNAALLGWFWHFPAVLDWFACNSAGFSWLVCGWLTCHYLPLRDAQINREFSPALRDPSISQEPAFQLFGTYLAKHFILGGLAENSILLKNRRTKQTP